jgi:predicted TIM-barrel fold metal-dependent hydrolase
MIQPEAAAAELRRAVTELGLVGMVTPQHIRDKNLSDPSFDVVWAEAERLNAAVCIHGGGQAPDQFPVGVDRFHTRLEVHALTHPMGNMLALMSLTVGGVLQRFPKLRVGFMESGCGWLPFWLERLDEHWELMPEQAPAIDRNPSEYFLGDEHLVYASDYYHWDCKFPDTVKILTERNDVSETSKKRILGENALRMYPRIGQ